MRNDAGFNNAVQVVGNHYSCGYLTDATTCSSTADAVATGKPWWASEFGSQDDNDGAGPYIRTITRGYLDGQMTGFMNQPGQHRAGAAVQRQVRRLRREGHGQVLLRHAGEDVTE